MTNRRSCHPLHEETHDLNVGAKYSAPPPAGWIELQPKVYERATLKAGLIALTNDPTSEIDLHAIFANYPDARLSTHRVSSPKFATLSSWAAVGDRLTDAARDLMTDDPLDVIAFACTSASIVLGSETVTKNIQRANPNAIVTNPMEATLAGLGALGAHRIALLTPYIGEVNIAIAAHLEERRIDVARKGFFRCFNDDQRNRVTEDSILAAATELTTGADCEALFISCTALSTVRLIRRIEEITGLPVVTSNQAMAWNMLRLGGETGTLSGYGRLLEL